MFIGGIVMTPMFGHLMNQWIGHHLVMCFLLMGLISLQRGLPLREGSRPGPPGAGGAAVGAAGGPGAGAGAGHQGRWRPTHAPGQPPAPVRGPGGFVPKPELGTNLARRDPRARWEGGERGHWRGEVVLLALPCVGISAENSACHTQVVLPRPTDGTVDNSTRGGRSKSPGNHIRSVHGQVSCRLNF
ncbi:unnamed protein product [Heterosigma akashiwo]